MKDLKLATILAALRYWQSLLIDGKPATGDQLHVIHEMSLDDSKRLTPCDIDELCETLNTDGIRVVCVCEGGVVQGCRSNFIVDFQVYDMDDEKESGESSVKHLWESLPCEVY